MNQPKILEEMMINGQHKAQKIAQHNLEKIYTIIGIH